MARSAATPSTSVSLAQRALAREAQTWRDAGFVPGATVADVGFGPAAVLVELARLVAPDGSATGVERDPESVDAARQVIEESGLDNVRLVVAGAASTGIQKESLDAVMLRHVLVHNDGPSVRAIIEHLRMLLRSGGRLYIVDTDLTAHRLVPDDPVLAEEAARYHELLRGRGCDPMIGPRLGHLLAEAGFEIELRMRTGRCCSSPCPG